MRQQEEEEEDIIVLTEEKEKAMVREMYPSFSPYTYKYISVVQTASEDASGRLKTARFGPTHLYFIIMSI